jgi:hypothetical protein
MFAYGAGVLGVQFHLEVTRDDVAGLVEHGTSELGAGPYVQSRAEMLDERTDFAAPHRLLDAILDRWSELTLAP